MKIPRLPEIDLARIASLPRDQQRSSLERMKSGHPPFSYNPLRRCFHDIFNVQPEMFGVAKPTEWAIVEGELRTKCRTEAEIRANLEVARALHQFATESVLTGRVHDFFSLSVSKGQKVAFWLPMVVSLQGRPVVPFIDPRQSNKLSPAARRFVFSIMHEHIRVADPDFETVELAVLQFSKPAPNVRKAVVYLDSDVELLPLAELEEMVAFTYSLWQEVVEERTFELRRRAGGSGGSLI